MTGLDGERFRVLLYWIRERESIRLKQEADLPRPWTEDPILHEWRFCNVDRCDDAVTKWIHRNVVSPHWKSPSLWLNLVVARLVNWPPTLAELGYFDEWSSTRFVDVLRKRASLGEKVWTGAYMIPAGPAGVEKPVYLAETLSSLWERHARAPSGGTCAQWAAFIGEARSMGDFLTNQVVTDMKYTPDLLEATDRRTFVLAGPGTQRGLNRLMKRPLDARWAQPAAQLALVALRDEIARASPEIAGTLDDLNNVANVCCEYDKYLRVLLDEGKPRARYVPGLGGF